MASCEVSVPWSGVPSALRRRATRRCRHQLGSIAEMPNTQPSTSPPALLTKMFATLTAPTIRRGMTALNGAAAGYGMDLALLCDIRIAGENGKMAAVTARRNLLPESGGSWLLPRLVGWAKASEIIFTGRTLDADQCLALGLVNQVVPEAELAQATRALANEIASNAPLAVQSAKRMMRMGLSEPFGEHVHHVFLQLLPLFQSQDFREGMVSFLEKREPKFHGK